jgi:acetyl esterase/lipase
MRNSQLSLQSNQTQPMHGVAGLVIRCVASLLVLGTLLLPGQAQESAPKLQPVPVAKDGTLAMPAQAVPVSNLLSPEAKAYVAQHLLDMQNLYAHPGKGLPPFIGTYLAAQKAAYPVGLEDTKIGGVHVYVLTPKEGIAARNTKRILINLHGGGFSGCWPECAVLESTPIASIGQIKVVAIDYREAPEYRFPAASEDVANVYAELLKKHDPKDIGIFGCSAGGALTAMSLAWFQQHNLPAPGAAGIFCAGAGVFSPGDAAYTSLPLGEARMSNAEGKALPPLGYLKDADATDLLVAQVSHPSVLAKFPPTLILTGSRDFALSDALNTHIQLSKAGVHSELFVWEGLFHGFFYNPSTPESRDAYNTMVKFFSDHLGSKE